MMAARRLDSDPQGFFHAPVMLNEVVQALSGVGEGVVVDATLGGAGHASALLRALPGIRLFGFDRDPRAIEVARVRLSEFGTRAVVTQACFDEIESVLDEHGIESIDGLVADLGVSSEQLTDPDRGMSFRTAGPIDMRMDPSRGETARELIERLTQEELADLIYELGEERASRRVARCIKQALLGERLLDTLDLRRAVVRAVGPRRVGGVDPATRTFQALRMAVNGEMSQLKSLLSLARHRVGPGGVAAVISFHSLEDRQVKRALFGREEWQPLSKKPLVPADEEMETNPRSRSAKLRAARRVGDAVPDSAPESA
jgi:16S rRNA (cytosine1402-N4)-methyltransferase